MELANLLQLQGYDPKLCMLLRHRPFEPRLSAAMPWIISERRALFEAYQSVPGQRVAGLKRASYAVSALGMKPGRAHFIGLYEIAGHCELSREAFWDMPENRELGELGYKGFTEEYAQLHPTVTCYTLNLLPFYPEWSGRLVLGFPPPERSWFRWLDRSVFPVQAVLEDSAFTPPMPTWRDIDLTFTELNVLPRNWAERLPEWRGIYLIFDERDGRSYVGSAYGKDNILGRWRTYIADGHGGNRELRERSPDSFRFTILERVGPDMAAEEVIARESSWKLRLHSRGPHGLNRN